MKQALGLLIIMGGGFIVYSALTNKAWVQSLTGVGASTSSGGGASGSFGTNAPPPQQTSTVFGGTQNNVGATGHGYTP